MDGLTYIAFLRARRLWMVALIALACATGCPRAPEATRPAVSTGPREAVEPPPAFAPSTQPASAPAEPARPAPPRKPKRPPLTWTKFVGAFEGDKDAEILARVEKGRIDVRTQNVQRMLIDFRELPLEFRRKGPWNLQIDQQGIEITGRRGWVLEMTRNDSGAWNVTGPKQPTR